MYKRRKNILFFLIIASIVLVSFYIYKQFIEDKPKVVVVLKQLNLQSWEILKAGAEKGFKDFNLDGKVLAPKHGTVEEQRILLEKVLKEDPDVLILAAIHKDLIPQLDEFSKRDIPVLLVHTDLPWKDKVAYIGTNNKDLGRKAGVLMATKMQPGNKVALLGRDISVELERIYGAKQSLIEGGLDIVVEKTDLSDDKREIEREIGAILKEHPDLKGIVTSSDYIALPILKMVREQGFDLPVTGTDGIPDMLELIQDGILTISVIQNPYDMGYLSIEAAYKVTKGERIETNIDSGVDIITEVNVEDRLKFYNSVLK
jgi:ribose transport system substrate-binding protein